MGDGGRALQVVVEVGQGLLFEELGVEEMLLLGCVWHAGL